MQRDSAATRRMAFLQSVDVDNFHPLNHSLSPQQPPPPPQVDEVHDDPDFKRATANSPAHRVPIVLVEVKPFSLTTPAPEAQSETIESESENGFEESVLSCELLLALNWGAEAVVVTEGYADRFTVPLRASRRCFFVLVKLDTKQTGAWMLKWLRAQLVEHIHKKRHNDNNNPIVCVPSPTRDTVLVPWSMFHVHAVLCYDWSSMVRSLLFLSERNMFRGQAAVDTALYAFYQEASQWAAALLSRGEFLRSDDPFFLAHGELDHELILLFLELAHYRHERMRDRARNAA